MSGENLKAEIEKMCENMKFLDPEQTYQKLRSLIETLNDEKVKVVLLELDNVTDMSFVVIPLTMVINRNANYRVSGMVRARNVVEFIKQQSQ